MQSELKNKLNRNHVQNAVLAILLFALSFVLFSLLRGNVHFMDEMDNFVNGLQMANGSVLYTDIFSQHMPLMYYINMLLALCGVSGVLGFRLAWYVILAVAYALLFLRYSPKFGKITMFIFPLFYIFAISQIYLASSILAEQLQAIGMVMLMLEFLHFEKTNEMSKAGAICIAIGINISFLSAFVSAFACAAIVLGFIIKEIYNCIKQKLSFAKSVNYLLKKYILTIVLTLAPMAALALHYIISGTFEDFFYKAVTFNMQVYSEFQGGLGQSPIGAVFGAFDAYINFIKHNIQTVFQGAQILSVSTIILNFAFMVFLFFLLFRRKIYAFFIIGSFFIMCGTRGFFNFHSLQIIAVCSVCFALLLQYLYSGAKKQSSKKIKLCANGIIIFLLVAYFILSGDIMWQKKELAIIRQEEFNISYDAHSYEALINTLTQPGEHILQNVNMEHLFLTTHAAMAPYHTGMSPWWWQATSEKSMQLLQQTPPNVAIFSEDYEAMGYRVGDFAPELTQFIEDSYTLLYEDAPFLYVHNSFYEQARAVTKNDENSDMLGTSVSNITCGAYLESGEVSQKFVASRNEMASLSIQFGTHFRRFTGEVNIILKSEQTGEVLLNTNINGIDIGDNEFTFVHSEEQTPIPLVVGDTYNITISTKENQDRNITVWAQEGGENGMFAVANGQEQNYTLRIKIR